MEKKYACSYENVLALNVYFESQGIPTALAWYAHHLPTWFLRLTTVGVNIFELVIPFLFFFPNRKVRITAFYMQVSISNELTIYIQLLHNSFNAYSFNNFYLDVPSNTHYSNRKL